MQGAEAVRLLQQEGRFKPDDRGLHLSVETVNAFAWFCPAETGIVDQALTQMIGDPTKFREWEPRLRSARINHIVVSDFDRGRLRDILNRLLIDPQRWPLLAVAGDVAVFGWRDRERPDFVDPFQGADLDQDRLAFHPIPEQQAPPKRPPEPRRWWAALWKSEPRRTLDGAAADFLLLQAEVTTQFAAPRRFGTWRDSQSASLIGAAGNWTGPAALFDAYMQLVQLQPQIPNSAAAAKALPIDIRFLELQQRFSANSDDTPPALLYLAIRAARRALALNPEDALAYFNLGECYFRLLHETRERTWSRQMPELAELRRTQGCTALMRAVTLRPELARAHLLLSGVFREMNYLDLALEHQSAYVQLLQKAGPPRNMTAEQFREGMAEQEKALKRRTKEVEDLEKAFGSEATRLRVSDRAALAFSKGLVGKAHDILVGSDLAAIGRQGFEMELDLLLRTGLADKARDWMDPEQKASLGDSAYYLLRTQALAATGDYAAAGGMRPSRHRG